MAKQKAVNFIISDEATLEAFDRRQKDAERNGESMAVWIRRAIREADERAK